MAGHHQKEVFLFKADDTQYYKDSNNSPGSWEEGRFHNQVNLEKYWIKKS